MEDVVTRMGVDDFNAMFDGIGKSLREQPGEILLRQPIALQDVKGIYCRDAYSARILEEILGLEYDAGRSRVAIESRPDLFPQERAA